MTQLLQTVMLYGERKTGKTTFALSAPKPMVVLDFELGIDGVEKRYIQDEDKITVHSLVSQAVIDKRKNLTVAKEFWKEIQEIYNDALEDPGVASIVLDTGSSVWDACRHCYLAELKEKEPSRVQLTPVEYTEPNRRMKNFIIQSRLHNKVLVITHHTKEEYVKNEPTGNYTWDGFKHAGDLCDVVLYFRKKDRKPYVMVEDCRLSMMAEGLEREAPTYQSIQAEIETFRNL